MRANATTCSGRCSAPRGSGSSAPCILVQFPVFTKDVLLANETVANIFIAIFTIGIGAGSMLTNALLKGEVSAKYVPLAAILMTVFLIDLYFAAGAVNAMLWPAPALNGAGRLLRPLVRLARRLRSVRHGLLRRPLCRAAERHHAAPRRRRSARASSPPTM